MQSVYWDESDLLTGSLVAEIGGIAAVERAVAGVLPGRRVQLRSLNQGLSGARVFLAHPSRFEEGVKVAERVGVLKLGEPAQIKAEVDSYKQWVEPLLDDITAFPLLLSSSNPDLGEGELTALFYRRVGNETLGDRLEALSAADDAASAQELLEHLFNVISVWQETSYADSTRSLTSDGVYSFKEPPFNEFEQQITRLRRDFDGIPIVEELAVRRRWEVEALKSRRMLFTVSHGDLNTENVLVGEAGGVSLIDFATVGLGHFLRDAATLEAHLIFRRLASVAASAGAHEHYLQEVLHLYEADRFLIEAPESALKRTFAQTLVMQIRSFAWTSLMRGRPEYIEQYRFALLRHAVRIVIREEQCLDAQRWIAGHIAIRLAQPNVSDRAFPTAVKRPWRSSALSTQRSPSGADELGHHGESIASRFFAEPYVNNSDRFRSAMRSCTTLSVLGFSHNRMSATYARDLARLVSSGGRLRVHALDPDASVVLEANRRSSAPKSPEAVRHQHDAALAILRALGEGATEAGFELRLMDIVPPYTIYLFDEDDPECAQAFVWLTPWRRPSEERPGFYLSASADGEWYTFFADQLRAVWNHFPPTAERPTGE